MALAEAEPERALKLDGPPWSTGVVELDLRAITGAIGQLNSKLLEEAAARKALEFAIEPLLVARGGGDGAGAAAEPMDPESLQWSVQRLEQEAYRQRTLEKKAISDQEVMRLQVDNLSREVVKCRQEAEEAGKSAAAAAISQDMTRIMGVLERVGAASQERIRLLEEQLGIDPPEGFADVAGGFSPGGGSDGTATAGRAGSASPGQQSAGGSPPAGGGAARRGSLQDQMEARMAAMVDSLRQELSGLGIPVGVETRPRLSQAGAETEGGGESAGQESPTSPGGASNASGFNLKAWKAETGNGTVEDLREEMDRRFREIIARFPPQMRQSMMSVLDSPQGQKGGGQQGKKKKKKGGVAGETIAEGEEGEGHADADADDGDEAWDPNGEWDGNEWSGWGGEGDGAAAAAMQAWKDGATRWLQQQVRLARKDLGLPVPEEPEEPFDLEGPGHSPQQAAQEVVRELRPLLGLDADGEEDEDDEWGEDEVGADGSEAGGEGGKSGGGGRARAAKGGKNPRKQKQKKGQPGEGALETGQSGASTSAVGAATDNADGDMSPSGKRRSVGVAADLAAKFREELAPWLAQQKGELGIDGWFPGLEEEPMEVDHGPSKVGGGGFAVTEILAQARREIIQQVRREIAPWVGQQAKRLEGYKNVMVEGKSMANEADFKELVQKVQEQLGPWLEDMQVEGEHQMSGSSFGVLRKLQDEMRRVTERVEDVVHLSKRRMNGGFVEETPLDSDLDVKLVELKNAIEEKDSSTQDHVAKVSQAIKGAQIESEKTSGKLDDIAGDLDVLRSRMDMALPQLFRTLDALARRTRDLSTPSPRLDDAGADAAEAAVGADAAAGIPMARGSPRAASGEAAEASAAPAEGAAPPAASPGGAPAEGAPAPAATEAASAPAGPAPEASAGDASAAGDEDGPGPEDHLKALKELLDTAGVPKPFASSDDVDTLKQVVDAAQGGTRSELGELRQELMRVLGGKADTGELRSLSEKMESVINDMRRLAQVLVNQAEDSSDGAAVFRVPMTSGRCVSCNAKVDVSLDKRNPWDKGVLPSSPWPGRRYPGESEAAAVPSPMGSSRNGPFTPTGTPPGGRRPPRQMSLPALDPRK